MNFTKLSGWIFLALGILLFIPTWGGSILFVGIAIIFFLTQIALRNKSNKIKNQVSGFFWLVLCLLWFNQSRVIILEVDGKPEKIHILTGIKNQPKIHSYWKLKNTISVDSNFIVLTSSNPKQVGKKFNVIDINGKNIDGSGISMHPRFCKEANMLIGVQTRYLKFHKKIDSVSFNKNIKLQKTLKYICETGS